MNFKSILISSASILAFASTSQAADVIVPEPEPMEYVRICDAYGQGFFYIPGTENCLKFSGYVRVDYQSRHFHADSATPTGDHRFQYRGRLNIDARNETEWGTLRSQLRFQGDGGQSWSADDTFSSNDSGPTDAAIGIDRALISLAGFNIGYSDHYWKTVGNDGYYYARIDGIYGDEQAIFLDYTYAANGLTLTIGMQTGAISGTAGQPDLYAGATYSGSWGQVYATYYQDSSVSAGAWKTGVELYFAEYLPGGAIKAWYMADDGDTDFVKGHVWGVSAKMDLIDDLALYAGYSDYDDQYSTNDTTTWTVGFRWSVVSGLYIQTEYAKELPDYSASTGYYGVRVVRSF